MRALALSLLTFAMTSAPALASPPSVQVTPVTVEFAPDKRIAAVRVRNESDGVVAFDAEMFAWSQEDGADVLTPAEGVIVTPPAFVVQPHKEQVLRVALPDGARAGAERSYRLILSQAYLDDGAQEGQALRVRLRMSLPVFAAPVGAKVGAPALTIVSAEDGTRALRISNNSARRVQLVAVESEANGKPQALRAPRYLLAGKSVDVPLAAQGTIRLSYSAAGGPVTQVSLAALGSP